MSQIIKMECDATWFVRRQRKLASEKFLCEKRANDALTLHPISEISTVKCEKDRSFWHFHLMPPQLFALIFHIFRSLIARLSSPVYSSSYPTFRIMQFIIHRRCFHEILPCKNEWSFSLLTKQTQQQIKIFVPKISESYKITPSLFLLA